MPQRLIGRVANSHDLLIMPSSRNLSGLLDSPVYAEDVEINRLENEMSENSATTYTVLHLRFKLRVRPEVFLSHSREAATIIASVQGLIWKIWVLENMGLTGGGV
jgi:hypothetical protein